MLQFSHYGQLKIMIDRIAGIGYTNLCKGCEADNLKGIHLQRAVGWCKTAENLSKLTVELPL